MARIGTATKRKAITTRPELARYIASVLSRDWSIDVREVESSRIVKGAVVPRSETYFVVSVECTVRGELLYELVGAPTLAQLVKRILAGDLWEKIRAEFLKRQVAWQKPEDPELLDEEAPAQPLRGIGNKQLALTYQPDVV